MQMAQSLIICSRCKRENTAEARYCKHCGRLLIEPDLAISSTESAPLYEGQAGGDESWEAREAVDVTHARVVIRVYPSNFDGSDSAVAQHVGEFALQGQTITIGRGQNNTIILDKDSMVSRQHAILRREGQQYTLVDLGSANGTFLNDLEISAPTPLNHGDRILIGQHEVIFLLDQPLAITAATSQPAVTAPQPAAPTSDDANLSSAHPTGAPAGATAKHASVARLSSEVAASASRMVAPQQSDAELDAIRARLVEASEALTRQAAAQAAQSERRRKTLAEARERIADLMADLRGDEPPGGIPTRQAPIDLIALASRVADDPNNLEHLRALANNAGAIAQALRAQGPTEGQWSAERAQTLRALEDIHFRLQERG